MAGVRALDRSRSQIQPLVVKRDVNLADEDQAALVAHLKQHPADWPLTQVDVQALDPGRCPRRLMPEPRTAGRQISKPPADPSTALPVPLEGLRLRVPLSMKISE